MLQRSGMAEASVPPRTWAYAPTEVIDDAARPRRPGDWYTTLQQLALHNPPLYQSAHVLHAAGATLVVRHHGAQAIGGIVETVVVGWRIQRVQEVNGRLAAVLATLVLLEGFQALPLLCLCDALRTQLKLFALCRRMRNRFDLADIADVKRALVRRVHAWPLAWANSSTTARGMLVLVIGGETPSCSMLPKYGHSLLAVIGCARALPCSTPWHCCSVIITLVQGWAVLPNILRRLLCNSDCNSCPSP